MAKKNEYPKLPKAFKRKWLEALRSGKYKQHTEGALYEEGRYCCLGVAGSLCGITDSKLENHGFLQQPELSSRQVRKIPKAIRGDAADSAPGVLSLMNDRGASFKQIANWIEKNL